MTYEEIIAKVAEDTGLPASLVNKTYKSFWRAAKEHIASLPLKEDLTDEEFASLRPNVNIPSLGKLYVTPERYRALKNSYNSRIKNVTHQED